MGLFCGFVPIHLLTYLTLKAPQSRQVLVVLVQANLGCCIWVVCKMEILLPKHKGGHKSKNILLKHKVILVAFSRYCQDLFHWNRYELLHKIYFDAGGPEFWKPGRRLCVHHSAGRWTRDRGDDPMVDWAIWWRFIVFIMKSMGSWCFTCIFPQSCMNWDHFGGLTRFAGNRAWNSCNSFLEPSPQRFFSGRTNKKCLPDPQIPPGCPLKKWSTRPTTTNNIDFDMVIYIWVYYTYTIHICLYILYIYIVYILYIYSLQLTTLYEQFRKGSRKGHPKKLASRPIARLFEKNASESGGSKRGFRDSFTGRISEK